MQNETEIDKIWRARGVLSSARLLSADEFMELVSLVRMGAARQIFEVPMEKLNELIVRMQPATINAANGQNLSPSKRDAVRAEAVRTALLTQGDEEV